MHPLTTPFGRSFVKLDQHLDLDPHLDQDPHYDKQLIPDILKNLYLVHPCHTVKFEIILLN